MIIRIFRVRIRPEQRAAFERDFGEISIPHRPHVQAQQGLVSITVGNPAKWKPEDYLLITTWENEKALLSFAGSSWNEAVIPESMEKYVVECWVDHFELTYGSEPGVAPDGNSAALHFRR